MFNKNSGYVGYSMSVRASGALAAGYAPKSHWTKEKIISCLTLESDNLEKIKKYSKDVLSDYFLEIKEWHHMGKYCKEIDFYGIDEVAAENIDFARLDELNEMHKQALQEKKEEKKQATKVGTQKKIGYYYRVVTKEVIINRFGKIGYRDFIEYVKTKNIDPYNVRLKYKFKELDKNNKFYKELRHLDSDVVYDCEY